jgi:hypothetical protein
MLKLSLKRLQKKKKVRLLKGVTMSEVAETAGSAETSECTLIQVDFQTGKVLYRIRIGEL